MEKIINMHCHIYPEDVAPKAVKGLSDFYGITLDLDGTAEGLLRDGEKINVVHYLVHSVATRPSQVRTINRFIAGQCSSHPGLFTGFGTLHPESEDIEGDIDQIVNLGLKGVKIHPDLQMFSLSDPKAIRIGQMVRDRGLMLLTHCGDYRFKYSNPDEFAVFIRSTEGLKLIGAHLGGWSVWDQVSEKIAGQYDILVDCCSCFRFMEPGKATALIRKFGADHVLWGTDYPSWNHEDEIRYFNNLGLTEKERQLILYDNASKLLGIKP